MPTPAKDHPFRPDVIRQMIAERGETLGQFASAARLSRKAVYNLLNGRHEPGPRTVRELRRVRENTRAMLRRREQRATAGKEQA